ncbi:protein kinase [Streptomyces sp. NPDC058067]|uniref:protein kinase domain-containing protein n=1 Tax=Streptomyces sp. NPDC058067 TaxID=3346324 RepID=UPI0036EB042C
MPSPLTHDDPVALGPYRLLARLGSGGMGTVYLGRTARGRTVALKTMHARIAADPDSRTRFRLEVDAARVIGGRYGAQVVDADPHAKTPWLATEYVLGPPLDDAVQWNGPLPEASVRALGAALASALGQLHRSDVVHRDLKPSNIMVTAYGPKVIDFGIARAIGDARLTRTGAAVGTPAFMSPEQATGQEPDAAGDVFALAGVLVFAATGHGPFGQGQPADLLYRVRYGEPDLGDVPPALTPLLTRCLAKDPGLRPTTSEIAFQLHDGSGEFADHLPDVVLSDIGRRASEVWAVTAQRMAAPAEGASAPVLAEPTAISRRRILALGGGVTGGVAAAGGGLWFWLTRSGEARTGGSSGESGGNGVSGAGATALGPLWQYKATYVQGRDPAPIVPRLLKGHVLIADGSLSDLTPKAGHAYWNSTGTLQSWQCAVDGANAYRFTTTYMDGEKKNAPPLTVETVDVSTGRSLKTVARIAKTNSGLLANQLVCASRGILYMAVGDGLYEFEGFLSSQRWTLRAVDSTTGRTLWTQPLPKRPNKSKRLHFLAAEVVGDLLVTFEEPEEQTVRIVVRDARTGRVRWQAPYDVDDPESVRDGIAADETRLYLGAGPLRALRLSDGHQVWPKSGKNDAEPRHCGPPALKSGVLYAVEEGTGLVAVNSNGGDRRWAEKADDSGAPYTTGKPVVGSRYVYYRNGTLLRAVGLKSHTAERTYVTTGNQFFGDEQNGLVIAVGTEYVAAFPLT